MSDKDFLILFMFLNMLMWFLAIRFMVAVQKKQSFQEKTILEMSKKQNDYLHLTHENICEMTKMNLSAMQNFLEQINKNNEVEK